MRRVRRNLDRVLVPARGRLDDLRGDFGLMEKAARRAAAQVDDAGDARPRRDLREVKDVLREIELEVVLLLEARGGDADGNRTVGDARTEDGHARLVSGRKHPVVRGDLGQLTTEQVQEFARRIWARLIELMDEAADPFLRLTILF